MSYFFMVNKRPISRIHVNPGCYTLTFMNLTIHLFTIQPNNFKGYTEIAFCVAKGRFLQIQ